MAIAGYVVLFSAMAILAASGEPEKREDTVSRVLRAETVLEARVALGEIEEQRKTTISTCLEFLKANKDTTHEEYGEDGFNLQQVMRLLGMLRAEEAVPALAGELLTFRLDYRGGIRVKSQLPPCRPAAVALVKIGGPQVIRLVLRRLVRAEDWDTKRICFWVLEMQLGTANVKNLLEQQAEETTREDVRKRLNKVAQEFAAYRAKFPAGYVCYTLFPDRAWGPHLDVPMPGIRGTQTINREQVAEDDH